jgi:phosphopentomutase
MTRALLIVLDSVGCGAAPDAARYGDEGADTLGHILRDTGVALPALFSLGLDRVLGLPGAGTPLAAHGRMRPRAAGKDSTTGHWEIAGAALDQPFATFDRFPDALVAAIEAEAGTRFLGNMPASGTAIIDELGPEHLRTGNPILYTSADSVLQIAAHERVVPVDRLYAICEAARRHADAYRIGRVIARPFEGAPGAFRRTARRHDFSMRPPPTVLDAIAGAGLPVIGVGKTGDLFAGQGLTESHPTGSNEEGMARIAELWPDLRRGLLFANLVDFDTVFGHRRDAPGYARALAEFDAWLARFLPLCGLEDLVILTADHGNDPTFRGTDHTREEVPLLLQHRGRGDALGTRDGFGDVAATLAEFFAIPGWHGSRSALRAPAAA